jgi:hypothetical protein
MSDVTSGPSAPRLVSHYNTYRDRDGHLVLMMPWPGRPVVGCAGLTAIVAVVAVLIAQSQGSGWYGVSVLAIALAVITIPIVIYRSSHAWVIKPGLIKPAGTFLRRRWSDSDWLSVRSCVLRRELWPAKRGSTDKLVVLIQGHSPIRIVTVYNWGGHESRLGNGGLGSLARSGSVVPRAPAALSVTADATLMSSVSEAVREIADLTVYELRTGLAYACGYSARSPDDTGA